MAPAFEKQKIVKKMSKFIQKQPHNSGVRNGVTKESSLYNYQII
jgi:hypothetical protein